MSTSRNAGDEYVPPSYPALNLYSHVLQKGFQAGGVIGLAVVVPAVAYFRKTSDPVRLSQALGFSALTGTVLSGAMCTAKYVNMTKEGLDDRVYRLHYNEGQQRVDYFSACGGVLGTVCMVALLAGRGLPVGMPNLVGGTAAGAAVGVLAHVLTRPQEQATPNKAVHEIKRDD